MKVTFEFDLPDENDEYEIYQKAPSYHSILWDIDQYCRDKLKHHELTPEVEAELECIRKMIGEI